MYGVMVPVKPSWGGGEDIFRGGTNVTQSYVGEESKERGFLYPLGIFLSITIRKVS